METKEINHITSSANDIDQRQIFINTVVLDCLKNKYKPIQPRHLDATVGNPCDGVDVIAFKGKEMLLINCVYEKETSEEYHRIEAELNAARGYYSGMNPGKEISMSKAYKKSTGIVYARVFKKNI